MTKAFLLKGTISRNDSLPFGDMFEVRKIYASGNAICTLNLDLDFLNLQYLELAGVQLTTLQANFGHLVSNVRVLNLNYNAISDLRPLFGIIRLKKLLLVGNRIRSMRKLAAILECFPSLSFLDLRYIKVSFFCLFSFSLSFTLFYLLLVFPIKNSLRCCLHLSLVNMYSLGPTLLHWVFILQH